MKSMENLFCTSRSKLYQFNISAGFCLWPSYVYKQPPTYPKSSSQDIRQMKFLFPRVCLRMDNLFGQEASVADGCSLSFCVFFFQKYLTVVKYNKRKNNPSFLFIRIRHKDIFMHQHWIRHC